MDGWVNGWVDGWIDGWVGGWMEGWMVELGEGLLTAIKNVF